ncbi:MAG TPA: proprotein convertase P-domain-containing protein [Phycisphaerae bacterium]|nr:proprotein convertase P-domain-containing protein [Phycisphaerae bacterium]
MHNSRPNPIAIRSMKIVVASAALALLVYPSIATALPPAPANDRPMDAEVISTNLPQLILGTTTSADDSITTIGDPSIDPNADGPDVFYSFTPDTTDTYRFQLNPWHHAPLRSSDRRFSVYVFEVSTNGLVGASRAPGNARPLILDVELLAGVEYLIGVDHNLQTRDEFLFTLLVDHLIARDVDNCSGADIDITTNSLPIVVLNDIDGATNDFAFAQDTGVCAVATSTATAPGIDHVYKFTAPADGLYAIELVGSGFDALLYIDDSCDPFFLDGCMGASNHSAGGTGSGKHEFVVVQLEQNKDYWIFVDNESTTLNSGFYALIIDDAFNYEVNEVEPNDTPGTATPIDTPLNGGQIVGPGDSDYWEIPGLTGDRVYAWANNGGSSNSTIDTDMSFFAADGTTLIEFDDEDADGLDSPIDDLYFIYSTSAPTIAGARFTSDASHYLQVNAQSATGTVHRYRMHVGVEPADRNALAECEPNNTIAAADRSGKDFFGGVVDTDGDVDFYAFEATAGDRIFISLDGDPERDSDPTQSASVNTNGFHGKLAVYDPAEDVLISDASDSNTVQGAEDYPAQAAFFIARTTGTHYVSVEQQSASGVGPKETYELAIFRNDAAPALSEVIDPLVAVTPDFVNDDIDIVATDMAVGDSGVCNVTLYDNTNLTLTGSFTPGDPSANLTIELVDMGTNGSAKLVVEDCAGNTACAVVAIDINGPNCMGMNVSNRSPVSMHPRLHIPDNSSPDGTTNGMIEIADSGIITDVNVTVNIETLDTGDIDLFLISPSGTSVELVTDRGSGSAADFTGTTFDDDGDTIIPILSGDAPYTGVWLPEDPDGLAKLNGEDAQGVWKLRVVDDSSSESFGGSLVSWSLDIDATFSGPEFFAGNVTDFGDGGGIASIVISSGTNTQLTIADGFTPGDQIADYVVTLIDSTTDGIATVTVTDTSFNTCQSIINLSGYADNSAPQNTGGVTTSLTYSQDVQQIVNGFDLIGVTSTISVPESFTVAEVEVALNVDATDQGRIAARLTHGVNEAMLVNRIGMDERDALGNSKTSFDVILDDDAPEADDIHNENVLGSEATLGLHQPDGRGAFFGDGITTDDRDNMLFVFDGAESSGDWDLQVIDARELSASSARNIFRRWSLTLKNPCGPEYYVGTAKDAGAETGILSVALAPGDVNLTLVASYTSGDDVVDYRVELTDPMSPGSGTVEITDLAGNVTNVPIALAAASGDVDKPVVTGSVNPAADKFEGSATDNLGTDTGIASVEIAPYGANLQIVSVTPDPPSGAGSVDFVVGLINPAENGRGYVRVTDSCGNRSHVLVDIDVVDPVCTGSVGNTKRYVSTDLPQTIPNNNAAGVTSSIAVTDLDIVSDVNITFNITHANDADIDMSLTSPVVIPLLSDIGSTANDFIDTTLDDEAAAPIPNSSSEGPFTGSYQPEGGPALGALDGSPAVGTYSLQVADDSSSYSGGTFDSWSVTIESATFPERYDGRAEDSAPDDMGICSITLTGGSSNLALTVDPFTAGDKIVRYSVAIAGGECGGTGGVEVADCAGNTCTVPITLGYVTKGDFNGDGFATIDDYDEFEGCLAGPDATVTSCSCWAADFNDDDLIDLSDFSELTKVFVP